MNRRHCLRADDAEGTDREVQDLTGVGIDRNAFGQDPAERHVRGTDHVGPQDDDLPGRQAGAKDEVGAMARAVEVFRENAIAKRETEDELRSSKEKAEGALLELNAAQQNLIDAERLVHLRVLEFDAERSSSRHAIDDVLKRRDSQAGEFLAEGAPAVTEAVAYARQHPGEVLELFITEAAAARHTTLVRAAFGAGTTRLRQPLNCAFATWEKTYVIHRHLDWTSRASQRCL